MIETLHTDRHRVFTVHLCSVMNEYSSCTHYIISGGSRLKHCTQTDTHRVFTVSLCSVLNEYSSCTHYIISRTQIETLHTDRHRVFTVCLCSVLNEYSSCTHDTISGGSRLRHCTQTDTEYLQYASVVY